MEFILEFLQDCYLKGMLLSRVSIPKDSRIAAEIRKLAPELGVTVRSSSCRSCLSDALLEINSIFIAEGIFNPKEIKNTLKEKYAKITEKMGVIYKPTIHFPDRIINAVFNTDLLKDCAREYLEKPEEVQKCVSAQYLHKAELATPHGQAIAKALLMYNQAGYAPYISIEKTEVVEIAAPEVVEEKAESVEGKAEAEAPAETVEKKKKGKKNAE